MVDIAAVHTTCGYARIRADSRVAVSVLSVLIERSGSTETAGRDIAGLIGRTDIVGLDVDRLHNNRMTASTMKDWTRTDFARYKLSCVDL